MIFDSDVLIWFFRKNETAKNYIRQNIPFSISAITYMELLQGALNKKELNEIKKFLFDTGTNIFTINESITKHAMEYVEKYALSDSMQLADALIAATAIEYDETLCTANSKHYKCIPNLDMSIFKTNE